MPIVIPSGDPSGSLAEFLAEFYAMGFSYLSDTPAGVARATRWINQAYRELCGLERWPFLEATVVAAAPATVADLAEVLSVVDTTNANQTLAQADQVTLSATVDLTSLGVPQCYYITNGTTVNVWPVATNQLSIRYVVKPSNLTAGTDTVIVPSEYSDVIVLGAVRRGLLDDTDAGSYPLIKQEWTDRVGMMVGDLLDPIDSQAVGGHSDDW